MTSLCNSELARLDINSNEEEEIPFGFSVAHGRIDCSCLGHAAQNAEGEFTMQLAHYCDQLRGACLWCTLKTRRVVLAGDQHHCELRALCVACFAAGHFARECRWARIVPAQKPRNLCGFCFLPTIIPPSHREHGMTPQCRYRDIMLPMCIMARAQKHPLVSGYDHNPWIKHLMTKWKNPLLTVQVNDFRLLHSFFIDLFKELVDNREV